MSGKEVMERSPLRVFERAIDGGLGRGNIGIVLSRPGVGKTGFLIGMALDALLQGRQVLHISTKETVERGVPPTLVTEATPDDEDGDARAARSA